MARHSHNTLLEMMRITTEGCSLDSVDAISMIAGIALARDRKGNFETMCKIKAWTLVVYRIYGISRTKTACPRNSVSIVMIHEPKV